MYLNIQIYQIICKTNDIGYVFTGEYKALYEIVYFCTFSFSFMVNLRLKHYYINRNFTSLFNQRYILCIINITIVTNEVIL